MRALLYYRKEENNDLTFFELRRDVKCFFSFNEKKHLKLREEIAMQMSRPKNVCEDSLYTHFVMCTYNNADGTHIESNHFSSVWLLLAPNAVYFYNKKRRKVFVMLFKMGTFFQ